MAPEYRTSYKMYSAWNYGKEIEDLNKASEQGWQLVKGGSFHSRFEKNPDLQYRYQIDFGKIENMGLYIETFREQGWEYINSTFNGWHYFRKIYDPSLPEEAYEIFTDRESLHEMNSRWARLALIAGSVIGLFAIYNLIQMIRMPELPRLALLLTFAVESAVLIRGGLIMHDPDSGRIHRRDGALLAVFFAVVVIGLGSFLALSSTRPDLKTFQKAASSDLPAVDAEWNSFDVKYRDNYYIDLELKSDEPLTVKIVDADGSEVWSRTAENFTEKNIRVNLPKGAYKLLFSHGRSGFDARFDLN